MSVIRSAEGLELVCNRPDTDSRSAGVIMLPAAMGAAAVAGVRNVLLLDSDMLRLPSRSGGRRIARCSAARGPGISYRDESPDAPAELPVTSGGCSRGIICRPWPRPIPIPALTMGVSRGRNDAWPLSGAPETPWGRNGGRLRRRGYEARTPGCPETAGGRDAGRPPEAGALRARGAGRRRARPPEHCQHLQRRRWS
jgi:hypothetical protein